MVSMSSYLIVMVWAESVAALIHACDLCVCVAACLMMVVSCFMGSLHFGRFDYYYILPFRVEQFTTLVGRLH